MCGLRFFPTFSYAAIMEVANNQVGLLFQGIYHRFNVTIGRLRPELRSEEIFQSMARIVQRDNNGGIVTVHQRS